MTSNSHNVALCDCKSGRRTLILLADDLATSFPEFLNFDYGWRVHPGFDVIEIDIGPGERWSNALEVCNFLRAVIVDRPRIDRIRAGWLNSRKSLPQQLAQLGSEAEPFSAFGVHDGSSQLLAILQERRIESWLQPVVKADSLAIWGYECLMRGRADDGSLISAPELLDWAKRENLTFMLDRVCRETHLLNAGSLNFGADCRFLINFIPTAIYKPEFCLSTSLAAMRKSGLRPGQIIFEVVETESVENTEHLLGILDFYRKSGFGIALDDLGSGYSGLTMLADLKPDLIKIDRGIVSKSVDSTSHLNVCSSLIQMGHDNGQMVLAEGVETKAEADLMKSLGVDLFQGYYFGKPQALETFIGNHVHETMRNANFLGSGADTHLLR